MKCSKMSTQNKSDHQNDATATPSSLASLKSRIVLYVSDAGLPRLKHRKDATKRVFLIIKL